MHSDEPYLTTGDVAKRLGVTPGAVSRWVQRGILTPAVVTPGGRYRYRWSEVQRQMKEWQQREKRRRGE